MPKSVVFPTWAQPSSEPQDNRGRTRSKGGATRPGEPLSFSRYYSVNEEPLGPFADDHHAGELRLRKRLWRLYRLPSQGYLSKRDSIASLVKEVH